MLSKQLKESVMSEFLTTKEVAELLRIKERKVYDLAARNAIPCAKATGKLLFPKAEIRQWMQEKGVVTEAGNQPKLVVLGSHDPVLEWALGASGSGLPTLLSGSFDGLTRYKQHEGIACAIHLENSDRSGWNTEAFQESLANTASVLVHWAKRERGLVVKPGSGISGFTDIPGKRLVTRQAAAGSQHVFERYLADAGIAADKLKVVREARTETEAALAILEDQADVAFGLRCFAERYKLDFIPVCEESYDLIIDRHAYFEPAMQSLLNFTKSEAFQAEAARYIGYDVSETGRVVANGAR
jgi:excisionase family DNA binding protein